MLWLDDRIIEGSVAPFDLTDRGLTLGDGIFDTALALDGRIVFEAQHRERLIAGAEALGIRVDPARVERAMRGLEGQGPRLAIRTTLTRGTGPRGIRPPDDPHVSLFATAASSSPEIAFAPLRLGRTEIRRNDTSPTSRWKTPNYLDAVLALREVAPEGFDEVLFLNTKGRVACAGAGNLFAVFGDALVTPPLDDGVLAGIVRAEIIALAGAEGLTVSERSIAAEEMEAADAVFLTNSLRLVAPVTAIGAQSFESAHHPVVALLQDALRLAMDRDRLAP